MNERVTRQTEKDRASGLGPLPDRPPVPIAGKCLEIIWNRPTKAISCAFDLFDIGATTFVAGGPRQMPFSVLRPVVINAHLRNADDVMKS